MTLAELQKALIKFNLDAYIVTRNNMFLGQDILPEENKVRELCGFSGSAGNMIVFRDKAFLFVDGRYELQAQMEVDASDIAVVCTRESLATWMQNNLAEPCTIAYDPWCHSVSEVDYWNRSLKRHTFVEDGHRLLGSRLSAKECEIFEHDIRFAGISMDEKISYLTEFMQKSKLDAFFISECDAVSWLLNLRSDCLPDTPIIRAFALVDKSGEVSLFTNDFKKIEVELAAYKGLNIGLTYNQTPRQIQSIMKNHKIWMSNIPDPIQLWKAVKNPIEISGFKNAHRRDAVAVIKFLYWLEHNWQGCNELDVVRKLHEFRAAEELFYSNSFETIAAFGPDGAIVHYQPTPQTNRELTADSCSSAGQRSPILRRNNRHHPDNRDRFSGKRNCRQLHSGAQSPHRRRIRLFSRKRFQLRLGRPGPRPALEFRQRLQSRNRPRRRLFPERSRRPA